MIVTTMQDYNSWVTSKSRNALQLTILPNNPFEYSRWQCEKARATGDSLGLPVVGLVIAKTWRELRVRLLSKTDYLPVSSFVRTTQDAMDLASQLEANVDLMYVQSLDNLEAKAQTVTIDWAKYDTIGVPGTYKDLMQACYAASLLMGDGKVFTTHRMVFLMDGPLGLYNHHVIDRDITHRTQVICYEFLRDKNENLINLQNRGTEAVIQLKRPEALKEVPLLHKAAQDYVAGVPEKDLGLVEFGIDLNHYVSYTGDPLPAGHTLHEVFFAGTWDKDTPVRIVDIIYA